VKTAVVLAAGMGTRIRNFSGNRPKPLLEIGGKSILARNLGFLARNGFKHVWINLHYEGESIQQSIGDGSRFGLKVSYAWETTILGTAGALLNIGTDLESNTFLVLYGDNLIECDLDKMIQVHRNLKPQATLAVFDQKNVPNTGLAGGRVRLNKNGYVSDFVEGADDSTAPFVNAGLYILEPSILSHIPQEKYCDFGRDIFPLMLKRGESLAAYPISGHCFGVDTPEAFKFAEEYFRKAGA
jgi:NDP-sugar pyrophosphorylase family protein